ncbi:hypothetical protein BY996DRAFT_4574549 [Phakopsora pachyrhizi]|nr:hypothetical protein BY996DRAFT_4593660 [Phakopsora pachyrhizi]KAI8460533.1 hypothetical protein BY996DRAFT_4574549 [Phakopsora pachyrhizi]
MPFFSVYITVTALGKLGHPDGEKNLTWAAGSEDMIQMVPTLASCSFEELVSERREGRTQWLQLYVNSDRSRTKSTMRIKIRRHKGGFRRVDEKPLLA